MEQVIGAAAPPPPLQPHQELNRGWDQGGRGREGGDWNKGRDKRQGWQKVREESAGRGPCALWQREERN